MQSNIIKTPLSVGLFKAKIFVVLPKREYSADDLSLIFRHEIVHIGRQDGWSKFFHVFCTAVCWFNPLMWIGMRKSADDIELSCDETVLLDADEQTRLRYANLLLSTATDERGFTSCLSASASGLRYRLKNVVNPTKKISGGFIVGLIFAVLCITTGYTCIVYGDFTGKDIIFSSGDIEDFSVYKIYPGSVTNDVSYICENESQLTEYLSTLKMQNIAGFYNFNKESEKSFTIWYESPDDFIRLNFFDNFVEVQPNNYYYLPDGVDLNKINELITVPPAAHITINYNNHSDYQPQRYASLLSADKVFNGEVKNIYKTESQFSYCTFSAYDSGEITLDFNMTPADDYTIEITPFDSQNTTILHGSELEKPFTIPISDDPAYFKIKGTFEDKNGNKFNAEFGFDIDTI